MIEEDKIPITIITGNYPARWFFDSIVFEQMVLKQNDSIIISTLHKSNRKAEMVVTDLKMVGWELGEPYKIAPPKEKNPWEEVTTGKRIPLTYIKYFLTLNPTVKAIMDEVSNDERSRDILLYQLATINEERFRKKEVLERTEKYNEIEQIVAEVVSIIEKKKEGKGKDA